MPPGANCNSHQYDKVNYSIVCPNTRAKRVCIENTLNFTKQIVTHIKLVLETDCPSFYWHTARLPTNLGKRYSVMQANTRTLCNAKVESSKHSIRAPMYKGLKKKYDFTNSPEYKFCNWFCLVDINRCVNGSKIKYMLDCHVVPNIWPVKIGTNLSRFEVLVLKEAGF